MINQNSIIRLFLIGVDKLVKKKLGETASICCMVNCERKNISLEELYNIMIAGEDFLTTDGNGNYFTSKLKEFSNVVHLKIKLESK